MPPCPRRPCTEQQILSDPTHRPKEDEPEDGLDQLDHSSIPLKTRYGHWPRSRRRYLTVPSAKRVELATPFIAFGSRSSCSCPYRLSIRFVPKVSMKHAPGQINFPFPNPVSFPHGPGQGNRPLQNPQNLIVRFGYGRAIIAGIPATFPAASGTRFIKVAHSIAH